MVAIFVLITFLFFIGIDLLVNRKKTIRVAKPEIFFHDFLPTPTMADGGKLIENKEKKDE
jgi:hypothetical protein